MAEVRRRISKNQKSILLALTNGFIKGRKSIKSTLLNDVINYERDTPIHPNTFRDSCETLELSGLIMRRKERFDWYINITSAGFEQALKWLNDNTNKDTHATKINTKECSL
ncbi:hypothetical protein [Vibrio sp. Hal054]|uniref:hypothetical protein n=1 Tax=Vibrio sp. Hal054 TaxID=3035158 RepID=UPI00301C7C3E